MCDSLPQQSTNIVPSILSAFFKILFIHQINCFSLQHSPCHFHACSQKKELREHGYLLTGDSTVQWRDVIWGQIVMAYSTHQHTVC